MSILETLSDWAGVLASIVSALFGGGFVAAYNAWKSQRRQDENQIHTQAMEFSGRLEERLARLEGRVDETEKQLRTTRKELTQSQIRREELSAAIDALVERIDKLIGRLAQHEKISDRERDQLTSVPYVETKSANDSTPK